MKIIITNNYEYLSYFTANFLFNEIVLNPKSTFALPVGIHPKLIYQKLVEKIKEKDINVTQINFIGLDE